MMTGERSTELRVGQRVRLVAEGARWQEIKSVSASFVELTGGQVSRRHLEASIESGRVQVER